MEQSSGCSSLQSTSRSGRWWFFSCFLLHNISSSSRGQEILRYERSFGTFRKHWRKYVYIILGSVQLRRPLASQKALFLSRWRKQNRADGLWRVIVTAVLDTDWWWNESRKILLQRSGLKLPSDGWPCRSPGRSGTRGGPRCPSSRPSSSRNRDPIQLEQKSWRKLWQNLSIKKIKKF